MFYLLSLCRIQLANALFYYYRRIKNFDTSTSAFLSYKTAGIKIVEDMKIELSDKYTYIVYGEHKKGGDNNALECILPPELTFRRVVSSRVAKLFGELYSNECILVHPKYSKRWVKMNNYSLKQKIFYFFLNKSAFFKSTNNSTIIEMINYIREGCSLTLFPSGNVGYGKWKNGLGEIIKDYFINPEKHLNPLNLISVNICYSYNRFSSFITVYGVESILVGEMEFSKNIDTSDIVNLLNARYYNNMNKTKCELSQ